MSSLTDRRDAVEAEIAALDTTKAGGKPNVLSGDGSDIDHEKYKAGLYAELDKLNALIKTEENRTAAAGGDVGVVESEEWT